MQDARDYAVQVNESCIMFVSYEFANNKTRSVNVTMTSPDKDTLWYLWKLKFIGNVLSL